MINIKSLMFPCFNVSIPCSFTLEEAFFRIIGITKERDSCFKVVRIDPENHTIWIIETTGNILFYNSFLPAIEARVTSENTNICIELFFSLRKSVAVVLNVISFFIILLSFLFFIDIGNQRNTVFIAILLLTVILVVRILSFIVFRFFVKRAMKKIVNYTGLSNLKKMTL